MAVDLQAEVQLYPHEPVQELKQALQLTDSPLCMEIDSAPAADKSCSSFWISVFVTVISFTSFPVSRSLTSRKWSRDAVVRNVFQRSIGVECETGMSDVVAAQSIALC